VLEREVVEDIKEQKKEKGRKMFKTLAIVLYYN
jgi:hypothetical protein